VTKANRLAILGTLTLGAVAIVLLLPRIPQDPAYNNFADQRAILGIPNGLNVLSNAAFVFVGVLGLTFLFRKRGSGIARLFIVSEERWPYAAFFAGVTLIAAGSAYYHLAPGNDRLAWDRLPIAFALMAFFSATVVERVSVKFGLRLLFPLLMFGVCSVVYWHVSEQLGSGDLRFYIVAQFYPLLAIPLILFSFPARYTRGGDVLSVLCLFILAHILELLDRPIFEFGHVVSGHTLKHLAAGLATYWVLRMLRLRSTLVLRGFVNGTEPGPTTT